MKYSDQAYNNRRMDERRAAGKLIDPAMAEIEWCWGLTLDPYYDGFEMPPECRQIGRGDSHAPPAPTSGSISAIFQTRRETRFGIASTRARS